MTINGNYVWGKRTIQVVESKSALEYLAGIERDTVGSRVAITVQNRNMWNQTCVRAYVRACVRTHVRVYVH